MTSFDPEEAAAYIDDRVRALGSPARAEAERRYLKSELDHLGVTVWQIRREVKAFGEEHPSLSHTEFIALVQALWSRPVHERRMAAALLLEAYPALVLPTDLTLLKRLIRESRTWALVDVLAGDVIGRLLIRHPRAESRLDRWAVDRDFWVRRAALLAMLEPLKHGAPFRDSPEMPTGCWTRRSSSSARRSDGSSEKRGSGVRRRSLNGSLLVRLGYRASRSARRSSISTPISAMS